MNLDIERYFRNGHEGYRCVFSHGDQWYYADLCFVLYYGNECMIFKCTKNKKVTDWGELYCNRAIELNAQSLRDCIEEFINEIENGD